MEAFTVANQIALHAREEVEHAQKQTDIANMQANRLRKGIIRTSQAIRNITPPADMDGLTTLRLVKRDVFREREKNQSVLLINDERRALLHKICVAVGVNGEEDLHNHLCALNETLLSLEDLESKRQHLLDTLDGLKNRAATAEIRVAKLDKFGVRHLISQNCTVEAMLAQIECLTEERDGLCENLSDALATLHAIHQEDECCDETYDPMEVSAPTRGSVVQGEGLQQTATAIRSTQELNKGRGARVWFRSEMIEAQQNLIRKHKLTGDVESLFYDMLSFWTGRPLDEVRQWKPLPSRRVREGHTQMMGRALVDKHVNDLGSAHVFGLKGDEGSMFRLKVFGMLASWAPACAESAVGVATPTIAFHGHKTLVSTAHQHELGALLEMIDNREDLEVVRWLWFGSDRASSNGLLVEKGQALKYTRAAELVGQGKAEHPSFMPADVRHKFLVFPDKHPRMLVPLDLHWGFDLIHAAKRSESNSLTQAFGPSVRLGPKDPRLVACVPSAALFSFARLRAKSHELRDITRCIAQQHDHRIEATIPGEIHHRLKMIPVLAIAHNRGLTVRNLD